MARRDEVEVQAVDGTRYTLDLDAVQARGARERAFAVQAAARLVSPEPAVAAYLAQPGMREVLTGYLVERSRGSAPGAGLDDPVEYLHERGRLSAAQVQAARARLARDAEPGR